MWITSGRHEGSPCLENPTWVCVSHLLICGPGAEKPPGAGCGVGGVLGRHGGHDSHAGHGGGRGRDGEVSHGDAGHGANAGKGCEGAAGRGAAAAGASDGFKRLGNLLGHTVQGTI